MISYNLRFPDSLALKMRMSVENGIVAFIVLVVVLELVIEGLEDEDRFAEDEDDYDIAAFTNNSIFSASRTLNLISALSNGLNGGGGTNRDRGQTPFLRHRRKSRARRPETASHINRHAILWSKLGTTERPLFPGEIRRAELGLGVPRGQNAGAPLAPRTAPKRLSSGRHW